MASDGRKKRKAGCTVPTLDYESYVPPKPKFYILRLVFIFLIAAIVCTVILIALLSRYD